MNQEKGAALKTLCQLFSELPFHRMLGLNLDSFDAETVVSVSTCGMNWWAIPHFKILHGGVIASILDTEAAFILAVDGAWHAESGSLHNPPVLKGGTIDMRIDYLVPGKGTHFIASGNILRVGNKIGVVRSELRNELNELIAVGTGTFLVG